MYDFMTTPFCSCYSDIFKYIVALTTTCRVSASKREVKNSAFEKKRKKT